MIATYALAFEKALVEAGYSAAAASPAPAKPVPAPAPVQKPEAAPAAPETAKRGHISALVALIVAGLAVAVAYFTGG
jgi:hypothetical protein